ncbi:MAG TPA: type VI secretion system lipoprotein TssJ [Steroidobacteraceae bacterium]|nr:type VI secretion system lipoprotein TssJ [Steroidobacteraceae bacterium]
MKGLAAMLALLLAACGQAALADPASTSGATTLELTVVGGPALNPNSEGRPSPVVVRIFDLAAVGAFQAADYAGLFDHPGDALKREVLAQEELVLRPGDILERSRSLAPQVQALGIAAGFRDLEHAVWRLAVPLKAGRRNFVLIDLDRDTVRLDTSDPGKS